MISLLNYLGKISERILAQRLAYLAETSGLLYNSQIRKRLKKSIIDIILFLTNKIKTNKRLKYKTIILFLDIKKAFDYISKNKLLSTLKKLRLLLSLIS
jgi:Reverse transcriptase (RNA-dependent DNA polymerase)